MCTVEKYLDMRKTFFFRYCVHLRVSAMCIGDSEHRLTRVISNLKKALQPLSLAVWRLSKWDLGSQVAGSSLYSPNMRIIPSIFLHEPPLGANQLRHHL